MGQSLSVVYAVRFDGFATLVGKQQERNFLRVAKCLQRRDVVVTNSDDLQPGRADPLDVLTQLHELLSTERSPVGGAIKHERNIAGVEQLPQAVLFAVLVGKFEIGCRFAYGNSWIDRWGFGRWAVTGGLLTATQHGHCHYCQYRGASYHGFTPVWSDAAPPIKLCGKREQFYQGELPPLTQIV